MKVSKRDKTCTEILNRYVWDDTVVVDGWWKDEEPKFGNALYHVIKMAEQVSLLETQREHIEKCMELLRMINDMEGR